MEYKSKRLEEHEKEIKKRLRETPFREGVYTVSIWSMPICKPKLVLRFNNKRKKVKGHLQFYHKHWSLKTLKMKKRYLLMQFRIDIIDIDIILWFTSRYCFEGYFDTPIGKIKMHGQYKSSLYGE